MSDHLDETALDEALQREAEALRREVQAERELSMDLGRYIGSWVAVREHQVVKAAETLDELLDIINPHDVDAVFEVTERVGTAAYY